jgi:hypothetical protein
MVGFESVFAGESIGLPLPYSSAKLNCASDIQVHRHLNLDYRSASDSSSYHTDRLICSTCKLQ